ncbi:MAG: prephenate dehydrogenase/arogenate dehydrogenase family protein [Acidobacteria bacterium]|nr:MAG: prephenate dehydrogenase/arogenate dehydrogenase family protein [Acidobacteriota bacterium]
MEVADPPCPFERVAILGLGLMGGSLGMALKGVESWGREGAPVVVGWNRTAERTKEALERGVIDVAASDLTEAADGADLIVVATPVSTVAEIAIASSVASAPGAVITDVGSVKREIVTAVESDLGGEHHFIGGHPMCGSELAGLDAARADLYEGATWVLTPTSRTDHGAFKRLQQLIRELGARVLTVDPESHDEFVAVVSHLPHLTAAALLNVAAGQAAEAGALLQLAAGGFRDVTRIASGSPALWADICAANRAAITSSLDALVEQIRDLRSAIANGDTAEVSDLLEGAREVRAALPVPSAVRATLCEVVVPVPDRPGILAEVSTIAGRMGVNIEDIGITHSVEGTEGILELLIAGQAEAQRVIKVLREHGFNAALRGEPARQVLGSEDQ